MNWEDKLFMFVLGGVGLLFWVISIGLLALVVSEAL